MSDVVIDDAPDGAGQHAIQPTTAWALAGMSTAAGVIHFAMTPIHAATAWQEALGFAAAGWFQIVTAAVILSGRGTKRLFQLVAVANAAFIGAWVVSRTAGLPFGDNKGVAESIGAIDASAVALQAGVILVALRLLLAPERRSIGRLAPALTAVAALGLATAVITSPNAANHNHGATPLTGIDALAAKVDAERCDKDFNIPAYWREAKTLGVDTRWGGNPPAVAGAAPSADGHVHAGAAPVASGSATTTTLPPDPFGGRGSPGLDELVSATNLAAGSEVEAANLVTALSDSSQRDYDAWLWWLRSSGTLSHVHDAATAAASGTAAPALSGHGGHVGAQPWVAMTDQAQCDELASELARARKTAMRYPTAQDAIDDGYHLVTGYLPGIASHFIKGKLIDGTFDIEHPEMLLYDGNTPKAHIVGLSYYLWHAGDIAPTQGFTGDNDHGHRHIGLCSSKTTGQIIGDSTTTEADCEARGGSKNDGSRGWMSHAWVVPGCESPWGVFSAASPLLDDDLGRNGEASKGHCVASGVRKRYGMGTTATAASTATPKPAKGSKTEDTAGG